MRLSWRKRTILSVALLAVCSCEKHHLGENPLVQREGLKIPVTAEVAAPAEVSPSPSAKPTPAEFFPTKP